MRHSMRERRVHARHPYFKIVLSPDDLPDDINVLDAGISNQYAWLSGKPEELDPPGLELTRREAVILYFLCARRAITGRKSLIQILSDNGFQTKDMKSLLQQVSQLRKTIRPTRVGISELAGEAPIYLTGTQDNIAALREKALQSLYSPQEQLEAIMHSHASALAGVNPAEGLRIRKETSLKLIGLLRGDLPRFRLPPEISTSLDWVIILGTVHAKPGLVTRNRLRISLFPFDDPQQDSYNLYQAVDRLNAGLQKHCDIQFDKRSRDGVELSSDNRQKVSTQFMLNAG